MAPRAPTFPFQNTFTPEEEDHIVHLKESSSPELSWEEIHRRFNSRFPKSPRSKGGLQVHYSRKLQPSKRKRRHSSTSMSDLEDGSAPSSHRSSSRIMDTPRKRVNLDSSSDRPRRSAIKEVPSYKLPDDSDSPLSSTDSNPSVTFSIHKNREFNLRDNTQSDDNTTQSGEMRSTSPEAEPQLLRMERPVKRAHMLPKPKLPMSRPSRAAKASRLIDLDRESSPQTEGWVLADPVVLQNTPNAPHVFLSPPASRIVEYNTRSKAYRIRCRGAGDPPPPPSTRSEGHEDLEVKREDSVMG